MDDETRESFRQLHVSQERARLQRMDNDRSASARAVRTTQEQERVRRINVDQQNVFRHRNARNQRNYRHSQGLDITDEKYAEYMTNYDGDFKIPLEEHPFVIAQQQKFRDETAKYEMRHCTVCRSRWPTTINLHKPIT